MDKNEIRELADRVRALFEEMRGGVSAEDFSAVARELGFEVVKTSGAGEEPEYTYHSEKQAGEGFWAVAPGAGDISEGMVWVSKKSGGQ
ncbi:MAG: hypothetical protein ACLFRF_08130 [Desulfobacterales bacterium]